MTEKEKLRLAAAISYKSSDSAPKIVAAGKGEIAKRIIETASAAGVPSVENPELASLLNTLNLGDEIPPTLYKVVAQILAYVCDMDKLLMEKKQKR